MIHIYCIRNIILGILLICIVSGCRKDMQFPPSQLNHKSFTEVFDSFWQQMNEKYIFWNVDTTNWDAKYRQFKHLFDKLDIDDTADVRTSVSYFRQMTSSLIDGHYSITFQHPILKDSVLYPALERKKILSGYHMPFPYLQVDTAYLDKQYMIGYDHGNAQNTQLPYAICGTINNQILYFSCNQFSLAKSYNAPVKNGVQEVLEYFFNRLNETQHGLKGIIIDVRGNFGGDLSDLNFLLGRIIEKPLHFGYTSYKSNVGRLDHTPRLPSVIYPSKAGIGLKKPVVVLADQNSASLSEAIAIAIKSMENGYFIGETTWGAIGAVSEFKTFNAGPFNVNGFMNVMTSSIQFSGLDGSIYGESGIQPNIPISSDVNALQQGIDLQLEKAISFID